MTLVTPAMVRTMFWVMAALFLLSVVTLYPLLIFYSALGFCVAGHMLSDIEGRDRVHR